MPTEQNSERNPLGKGLQLLRWMLDAPDDAFGVHEIAKGVNMSPSTVHRLLQSLETEGLVSGDTAGHYRIGLELCRIGWQAQTRFPVHNLAMPILRDIVAKTNETAFLALYDPQRMEILIAAAVESPHPVRFAVPVNQWSPVYCAASGMAIMAFLPEAERREIVERTGLKPVTPRSITDPVLLEQELERIRQAGYACTAGQRVPGAVSLSAPVWDPRGQVLGDLNLTFPEFRIAPEEFTALSHIIRESAAELSHRVGGRQPVLSDGRASS